MLDNCVLKMVDTRYIKVYRRISQLPKKPLEHHSCEPRSMYSTAYLEYSSASASTLALFACVYCGLIASSISHTELFCLSICNQFDRIDASYGLICVISMALMSSTTAPSRVYLMRIMLLAAPPLQHDLR